MPASRDDYSCLEAFIPGPIGSPYEKGIFKLAISIGEQYPFRPPTFKFITPVFHPNIDNCKFKILLTIFTCFKYVYFLCFIISAGKICLDLLRMPPTGSYNPAITLESILLSIQLLLANPNPDDSLQGDAADLYKSSKELFCEKAREYVEKYCRNLSKDQENIVEGESPKEEEVKKKRLKLCCK